MRSVVDRNVVMRRIPVWCFRGNCEYRSAALVRGCTAAVLLGVLLAVSIENKQCISNKQISCMCCFLFLMAQQPPLCARASSFTTFLDHTQRRTTVGRTHLDE